MEDVLKYYENYNEEIRLEKSNIHKTEYLTTINYLDKVLKPNSTILDVCAGTGKYSFYLEEIGRKKQIVNTK